MTGSGQEPRLFTELVHPELVSRLHTRAAEASESYSAAAPFPHTVLDDFLPAHILQRAVDVYPGPDETEWLRFEGRDQIKLACENVESLPAQIQDVLYFLNSAPMLRFLEQLTGIDGLIPDPYFRGGGLHQIRPGGKLGVHADFNHLPKLRLERRLNLLLFLNHEWDESYGGHLELWQPDMSACARRVLPVFNRCVVFSTTDRSYHGHPEPLTCPEGRFRRSIATYYYTNGRPEDEVSEPHTTMFRSPQGQWSPGRTVTEIGRRWLPPAVADLIRSARKYRGDGRQA